jgi:hypothetical protein
MNTGQERWRKQDTGSNLSASTRRIVPEDQCHSGQNYEAQDL